MEEFKPGQVIVPAAISNQPPTPSTGAPEPVRAPIESPQPPAPVPAPEPQILPTAARPVEANWQYNGATYPSEDTNNMPVDLQTSGADPAAAISWTAAEFVAHEKSQGWYLRLAIVSFIAVTLAYLITKDKITTGVVLLAAVALGVFAARKPQTQDYGLNVHGVVVGNKAYGFQDFKSFSLSEDGTVISVVFMPLKRFMPALTIYVSPEIEDRVIDFLSAILPFEQHRQDAVDSLMKRIRF